jgi:hypothetical protein
MVAIPVVKVSRDIPKPGISPAEAVRLASVVRSVDGGEWFGETHDEQTIRWIDLHR